MDLREKTNVSQYVVYRLIHLHALFSSLIHFFFPFHICPTILSLSLSIFSMVESHLQLTRCESPSIVKMLVVMRSPIFGTPHVEHVNTNHRNLGDRILAISY